MQICLKPRLILLSEVLFWNHEQTINNFFLSE